MTAVGPTFFIVGMERSGTHWVSALLNHHPEIACFPSLPFSTEPGKNKIGEVHFFNTLASLEPEESQGKFTRDFNDFSFKYNKVFSDLVPLKGVMSNELLYEKFKERYNEYCDQQKGEKKIVGESTPAYIFHLDFIDRFYPESKKIAIIRDPKDKIVSWHFNLIRKDRIPADTRITEDFALEYLKERIIPEYEALLSYDGSLHVVSYESMHADGVRLVKGMVDYLGISISDDIARHMLDEASFKKQTKRDEGSARERGEENVKSGFRKGVTGDWKNHLSEELAKQIDDLVESVRNEAIQKYTIYTV